MLSPVIYTTLHLIQEQFILKNVFFFVLMCNDPFIVPILCGPLLGCCQNWSCGYGWPAKPAIRRPVWYSWISYNKGRSISLCFSSKKITHQCMSLHWNLGPIYTGPDKFLYGRILFLDHLFTWICANSVKNSSGIYTDPCKFWASRGIWMAFLRLCYDWLSLML